MYAPPPQLHAPAIASTVTPSARRDQSCMLQAIRENLKEQGIPVLKVALYGYVDDTAGGGGVVTTGAASPKKPQARALRACVSCLLQVHLPVCL